ncbi:MAG: mandelate racemase [Planctomycetes bacterium]|nr:mandelate racemase [Planctomycetota bacterium]
MHLKVHAARATTRPFQTRLPFRFGAVTITNLQRVLLSVDVSDEAGRHATGFAADFMVPRWFDKRPEFSPVEDVCHLEASLKVAVASLLSSQQRSATVFQHWLTLERTTFATKREDANEALVAGFGLALVERALMDAACRLVGVSFHAAVLRNLFGFEPEQVLPELAGWRLERDLPQHAATKVRLRHTVGFLDALRRSEAQNAPNDGLPAALEDDIDAHGLSAFKLKLSGTASQDLARLQDLAALLCSRVPLSDLRVTLDANEQYEDIDQLTAVLDALSAGVPGRQLLAALAFVEQPLPRRQCCAPGTAVAITRLNRHAPVLLDEGDSDTLAFSRARHHGWHGVSVKPCKGVFRALLNHGLVAQGNGKLFLSAEDLTCPPTTALQQDLALVATLGLPDVEKNAHHYFRGLDALSAPERDNALRTHPQLYERSGNLAQLAVHRGFINLRDLDAPGFGGGLDPRDAHDTLLLHEERA